MSTTTAKLNEASQASPEVEAAETESGYEIIIEPKSGWRLIDWKELSEYRDLFRFLIWRNVKARYAQSALGIGWAIIQPMFSMIVFTIIFGYLAGVQSDGAPYAVFTFAALVPWTYFSNAVTAGTASLVTNANMISKVYFPRMILPLAEVCAKLIDFCIAMVLLAILMACHGMVSNLGILLLPYLIGLMILTAAGLGMWLTALAVQYRDVNYAINFIMQTLMYCAPVVYPASLIPWSYNLGGFVVYPRLIYAMNPMVGVIEGFRSALLGTVPMPWGMIGIGSLSAFLIALTGALYFRRKERLFADVA